MLLRKLLQKQPLMGKSQYDTYNYAIYIDKIDTENMAITCSYVINYDGTPIRQIEPKTSRVVVL